MPLIYDQPSVNGPLLQGEILAAIVEQKANAPANELPLGTQVDVTPISHPFVMVMTAVCDLEQDFDTRFSQSGSDDIPTTNDVSEREPKLVQRLVQHMLLCDVYTDDELHPLISGGDIWRRIRQNQDERYHQLTSTSIAETDMSLPDFYMDFKRNFTLPTSKVYDALFSKNVRRVAVVPPVYVHDLMQRFYSFLSRVGVPE